MKTPYVMNEDSGDINRTNVHDYIIWENSYFKYSL